MVKESSMLMNGQTDFLELLLGDGLNGLSADAEVNLVFTPDRQTDDFDQQLDPSLDINSFDDLTFVQTDQSILDVCDADTVAVSDSLEVSSLGQAALSQPQHFLFDAADIAELQTIGTGTEVTDMDDLISSTTEVSNVSDFTDSNLSPAPRTPSTAGSVTSIDSLVPVFVRQGLKASIQKRRRVEGKGELEVSFVAPAPEKLTAEEEEKRIERREKNRLAAQKCRGKKKERADVLEAETKKLQKIGHQMKLEIQKLLDERDHLMDAINVHKTVCPMMRAQSSSF